MEEEEAPHQPPTDMEEEILVLMVRQELRTNPSLAECQDQDQESLSSLPSHAVHTADLEKTNAVVAAFTVVAIFCLLFLETVLSVIFMIFNASGDMQSVRIAHSKNKERNV